MAEITLKSADSQCLASLSGNSDIFIYQQQKLRWLSFGKDGDDDIVQSVMDITAPQQPILRYLQAMAAMLAFSKPDARVLNLGFGGGSLVRFIHHHLPKVQLTSVEQQGAVVELSRRYFNIPDHYQVTIDSANNFLNYHRDSYPLQLIDLPLNSLQPQLLQNCRKHLEHDGVAVFNLFYRQAQQLPPVLSALRQQFPVMQLLDINNSPNLIVVASIKADLYTEAVKKRADQLAGSSGITVTQYFEQLLMV